MLDDQRFDVPAGPMPESISRAVTRRRVAIRTRRAGALCAVLLVAGAGAWLLRSGATPETSTDRIMAQGDQFTDQPDVTRFTSASVLALRLAGPEHATATPVATRPRGDETVFGLRQRELDRPPSPAS